MEIRLKKTLITHSKSAIRELVYVGRLAARLKKLREGTDHEPAIPSTFGALDNGYFTTFGGHGHMVENFKKYRKLGDYTGRGIEAKNPEDENYSKSRMRYLPFDLCFMNENKTVDKRK